VTTSGIAAKPGRSCPQPAQARKERREIFHTRFAYDRKADAWQWKMDGEERLPCAPSRTRPTGTPVDQNLETNSEKRT